jgi:transcription elongation factor Elf1
MSNMVSLVAKAKAKGYTPVTVGRLLKLYKCPDCGFKKAVIFKKDNQCIAACPCGFRRKSTINTNVFDGTDYYCKAITKTGRRCHNPAKYDGYCGVHRNRKE